MAARKSDSSGLVGLAGLPTDAQANSDFGSSGTVESGQSEHALLAAGKISVEEFMDMSVERALSHLQGQVDDERLESMRLVLRSQLEQDPHLSRLVAEVTEMAVSNAGL